MLRGGDTGYHIAKGMARPERFELPTLCFEGRCSIQLSYGRTLSTDSS
jgi:hypothetical protein